MGWGDGVEGERVLIWIWELVIAILGRGSG